MGELAVLTRNRSQCYTPSMNQQRQAEMVKAPPARGVVKQIGLWLLLMLLTALATLLFNILGAITMSVATAIALGASRRWQWQTIPVSLTFPLVALVMALVAKVDFDPRQRLSLLAVCFGAFWMTYLLALVMLSLEKRGETSPGSSRSPEVPVTAGAVPAELDRAADARRAEGRMATGNAARPILLEDLKGTWLSEAKGPNRSSCMRLMDISQGRFALRILNDDGSVSLVAEGEIVLEGDASPTALKLSPAAMS